MGTEAEIERERSKENSGSESGTSRLATWKWYDLLIVSVLTVLGIILASVAMLVVYGITNGAKGMADLGGNMPPWYLGMAILIIDVVAIWAIYRRTVKKYKLPWSSLGVNSFSAKWALRLPFIYFAQFGALIVVGLLFILPIFGMEYENPQTNMITGGQSLSPLDAVVLFLAVAVLTPIAEELFFRGMLHSFLRSKLSMWPSIIINASVFAFIHLIPTVMPMLFVIGLFLAWVREKTESVIPSMILHGFQNSLALSVMYFATG